MNHETKQTTVARRIGLLAALALAGPIVGQQPTATEKAQAKDHTLVPWAPQERETEGAEYTRHFGTTKGGGALRVGAEFGADSTPDEFKGDLVDAKRPKGGSDSPFEAKARLGADVRMFGRTLEALKVERAYGKRAEITVLGLTVKLPEKGRRHSNATTDEGLGHRQLLPRDIKASFMVGPVPVIITGNAGLGMELAVEPEASLHDGVANTRFGLEGEAGVYVEGWVAAGVGFDVGLASAQAGVQATLRLLHVTAGVQLSACPGNGDRFGELKVGLAPCSLKLALFALARVWRFEKRWSHTVYAWSAKALEWKHTFCDTVAASSTDVLVQRATSEPCMRRAIIEILARRTITSALAQNPDVAAITFVDAILESTRSDPESSHERRCASFGIADERKDLTAAELRLVDEQLARVAVRALVAEVIGVAPVFAPTGQ